MKSSSKTIWIILFALAMGYLEASVVVYLRAIYYPEGFNFPLKAMAENLAVTELYREAATVIMIFSVSALVAKLWLHRFAWFLVVFAIWDIAYYLFLKVLIGWPDSLLTMDILFLLPGIWTGPVLAPIINSLTMIALASVILAGSKDSKPIVRLSKIIWILLISGSLIVLVAYLEDFSVYVLNYRHSMPSGEISWNQVIIKLSTQFVPRSFDWSIFCIGVGMHFIAILILFFTRRTVTDKLS